MKKIISSSILAALSFLVLAPLAFAINAPTIDPIKSPVDANKQKITGTAEANTRITVMGGPARIAPVNTDAQGKFEITVGLAQETTNNFIVRATDSEGNQSEPITIEIVESTEEAKKLSENEGIDNIAPDSPIINDLEEKLDADTVKIKGNTEAEAKIEVSGDDNTSTVADKEGKFEIEVYLKQNKKNTFSIVAIDTAGNISPGVQVVIHEEGAKDETETTEEENNNDGTKDEETTTEEENQESDGKIIADPFTDIAGHWGEDFIETLRLQGNIQGYADGTFRPNNSVNRAELTIMALNVFEYELPLRIEEKPFPDVNLGLWYTAPIEEAKNKNIVAGFPDGTFHPANYITRAAALKILMEASNLDIRESDEYTFPDVNSEDWYSKYASFAKQHEIVQGYEDGTFQPGKVISRAEVAVMLVKIINKKQELANQATI